MSRGARIFKAEIMCPCGAARYAPQFRQNVYICLRRLVKNDKSQKSLAKGINRVYNKMCMTVFKWGEYMTVKETIASGKAFLGIEFGSTRVKAVLTDESSLPIASGAYDWENSYKDGIWYYPLEQIHEALRGCYASLCEDVQEKYGTVPTAFAAMGVSGMMHGYMAFDKEGRLLVPFRTWRNTITAQAAGEL